MFFVSVDVSLVCENVSRARHRPFTVLSYTLLELLGTCTTKVLMRRVQVGGVQKLCSGLRVGC